jgi:hypothetical protein
MEVEAGLCGFKTYKMKDIKKLLKQAENAKGRMDGACGQIASILQPFFKAEITVDFQPGDGFVVIWEDGAFTAPNNLPVEEVLLAIKTDKICFSS